MPCEDSVDLPGYRATAVMSSGLEPSLRTVLPVWDDKSQMNRLFWRLIFLPALTDITQVGHSDPGGSVGGSLAFDH
ncbi:hypothetical protein CapIbe_021005 [Capra ibex]